MQGKFIVFEGIDKAGKRTQAKMLCSHLRKKGLNVIYTEEPSPKNEIGKFIKQWLSGKFEIESGESITLLYAADRFEHLKREIEPALEKGTHVICDRYFYSTIAYESAIFGVSQEWIRKMHEKARKPDLVIFIDISPEISLARKRERPDDRLEKVELLKKVREAYLKLANEEKFFVLDGNRSKEEIFNDVKKIVETLLMKR
jgi:dTMP kinase